MPKPANVPAKRNDAQAQREPQVDLAQRDQEGEEGDCGGDKAAATKEFQAQQSVIDRIADKKIVHKNAASRNKMRLAQAIKALP